MSKDDIPDTLYGVQQLLSAVKNSLDEDNSSEEIKQAKEDIETAIGALIILDN